MFRRQKLKPNSERGTKGMRERGFRRIEVWYTQQEYALVEAAAAADGVCVAVFCRLATTRAASGLAPPAHFNRDPTPRSK